MNARCSLVLPGLAVALSGCATFVHGTRQDITILSAPANARVRVDTTLVGVTPLEIRLPRKQAHQVRIEAEGYQPFPAIIARRVSGWAWGNVFFYGITVLVDAQNGSLYNLEPEQIRAALTPIPAAVAPGAVPAGATPVAPPRPVSRLERTLMVGSRVRASGAWGAPVADGTVTSVRGDTIEVTTAQGTVRLVLPFDRIERLELAVGRRGRGGQGALIGLVAGAVLGWATFYTTYTPCEPQGWFDCMFHPETQAAAGGLGAFLGGMGGAAWGLLLGARMTTERWQAVPLDGLRVGVAPLPAGRMGLGAALAF